MPDPRPTIGAAVHFCSLEGQHCAAVVTAVHRDGVGAVIQACGLFVMHPDGVQVLLDVPYDDTALAPGCWHWAEGCRWPEPAAPLVCETCGDAVGPGTPRAYATASDRGGAIRCEACLQTRGWE